MATEPQWLPGYLAIVASSHFTHVLFCCLSQVVLSSCYQQLPHSLPRAQAGASVSSIIQPFCLLLCEPRSLDSSIPLCLAFLALSVSVSGYGCWTPTHFSLSQHPAQATPSHQTQSPVPCPLTCCTELLSPQVFGSEHHTALLLPPGL